MNSVIHILPETHHGLKKKVGRKTYLVVKKKWISGCLCVIAWNRGRLWSMLKNSWRSFAQTSLKQTGSNFAIGRDWCSSCLSFVHSHPKNVENALKMLAIEENTKGSCGLWWFWAEIVLEQSCKNERKCVFCVGCCEKTRVEMQKMKLKYHLFSIVNPCCKLV